MRPRAGFIAAAVLTAAFAATASAQEGAAKRILVYGDSLTWGWTPSEPIVPSVRHAMADRWTTALAAGLGQGHELVVEGLSGRTTNIDDPNDPKLNGSDYLPAALASHEPLDLVVIMLGTNDTKAYLERTPLEIGLGAGELINIVHESPGWNWTDYATPRVLLVSPPPLGEKIAPGADKEFAGGRDKSMKLPEVYRAVAQMAGEHFFDAGSVIATDGVDGIHFTAAANQKLGSAVAQEVKRILGD